MEWKVADAKNKFSELINKALLEGPQRVRRRDESVFVLSAAEFAKLTGERPSFKAFLRQGGESLDGIEVIRDASPPRDVEL